MGEDFPLDPSHVQPVQGEQESQSPQNSENIESDSSEEDAHDTIKQYATEIYKGAQVLLAEAQDLHSTGPNGWKKGSRPPSYISGEFKHNVAPVRLRGPMNSPTMLFTERLRIQETNVVSPYERMEGDKIGLELLEVPEDPKTNFIGDDKDSIENVKRLSVKISPNGEVEVDSYLEGDGRAWGDVIQGPGSFGITNAKRLQFGEDDAKNLMQLITDIRADVQAGLQRQEQPGTVFDSEKAHTMALASKLTREGAASMRAETQGDLSDGSALESRQKYADNVSEILVSERPEIKQALEVLVDALQKRSEHGGMDGAQHADSGEARKNSGMTAEETDAKADKIENWAGIMSEKPLSEAYKKRFGFDEWSVTPTTLAELETEVESYSYNPPLDIKLKITLLKDIRSGRANLWQ